MSTHHHHHTSRKRRRAVHPPGLPPGTLIISPDAPMPVVHAIGYGPESFEEMDLTGVTDLSSLRGRWPVLWVNVNGLGDAATLERLGAAFGLHPLALEDVVNTYQRPKLDSYEGVLYVVMRELRWAVPGAELDSEQVSLFMGKGFVLTLQEAVGDSFDPVRNRIRGGRRMLREAGADYLAYALLDSIVDSFFPLLQSMGDALEDLEEAVAVRPTSELQKRIRKARHALLLIRRATWPLRDVATALQAGDAATFQPETRPYLHDLTDHALRIIDLVETHREQASSLAEAYMTSLGFRTNEVMAVLTVVGTIFLPLSFLTGLYGMNFDREVSPWNMPELGLPYGYPALVFVMITIAVGMLAWFRRRGWLSGNGTPETLDAEPDLR